MQVRCGEYDGELCDKVSTALRVTETPGSCTIHSEEYDVNEGASGEDSASRTRRVGRGEYDGVKDATSMMAIESAKPLLTLALSQDSACSSLIDGPLFSSPFTSSYLSTFS